MKIISHRGNICGPVEDKENRPSYIDCAIGNGYDVEIDIRVVDGELWLGHDKPQFKITHRWLRERRENLWIHCKNYEASKECWIYQSFCHTSDPFTYTSVGKIWLHDLTQITDNRSIIPLINKESVQKYKQFECYGICTDYPILIKI
jgi:hypothetical protein